MFVVLFCIFLISHIQSHQDNNILIILSDRKFETFDKKSWHSENISTYFWVPCKCTHISFHCPLI